MSKSSRAKKRNRANVAPGPVQESPAQIARRFFSEAAASPGRHPSNITIGIGPAPAPASPADTRQENAGAGRQSRSNSIKHSLRSKILFSQEMFALIAKCFHDYEQKFIPTDELESYLVRELARSATQDEKCAEQLDLNAIRIAERIGSAWDLDRAQAAKTLGSKLGDSPQIVAGALATTKHGALYLINQWSYLEDAIKSNNALDEQQRSVAYDLLGIDHVYRNGNRQVPAGSDGEGLRALVTRQLGQLRSSLERTLNACDTAEQGMAILGIAPVRDAATRLLRADQNRARRRFEWALATLQKLRQGADPATLIDPDTGKPVAPGPRPTAVTDRVAPAAPPPTATPPPESPEPEPESEPTPEPSPLLPLLPAGIPAEAKEMMLVAAEAVLARRAAAASARTGQPPTA